MDELELLTQVLNDMVKETFGDNFGVAIQRTDPGKYKIIVHTMVISSHEFLEDLLTQDRQFIAQSMNNHLFNAMTEIADECLKLSDHVRSKLS